jgi:amino acid adenylation domain-containing protein
MQADPAGQLQHDLAHKGHDAALSFDAKMLEDRAFWLRRLSGWNGALSIPGDRPRLPGLAAGPAGPAARSGEARIEIEGDLYDQLARLTGGGPFLLYTTLTLTLKLCLYKYTSLRSIAVGSPARRSEDDPGEPDNAVVIADEIDERASFKQLLLQQRQTLLEAYARQSYPHARLLEDLQRSEGRPGGPLFRIAIALDEIHGPLPELGHDISFAFQRVGARLSGKVDFSLEIYRPETIERLLRCFRNLLAAGLGDPGCAAADLQPLDTAQRQHLLREWNATGTAYPRDSSLPELFQAQAERAPEAVALAFGDEQVTYGALARRADGVASRLARLGAGPGVLVGICAERSVEHVVGILGILRAGAAYLPLDPGFPDSRLQLILDDARAPILLTPPQLADRFPEFRGHRELLGTEAPIEDLPAPKCTADDLAYVIYTSGSTGKPKGVAVPQRAVTRLVLATDYVALGPGDRIAQASPMSFDAATFELWGTLLNGGCLVEAPKDVALSPQEFGEFLARRRITTLFLTTALFNQMAREAPWAFRGLRNLLFGGEAVDPAAVRQVLAGNAPQRLLHVYGPTESTTFATWFRVTQVRTDAAMVPIGRPIANTGLYLIGADAAPVPPGGTGEVYLGGDGLARGYVGDPALTAAKFVPDPFSGSPGARLYRTGDLARLDADEAVEFLGRGDDQVKLRGFRIEPGEIESVLRDHPEVVEAAVLVREDTPGARKLVAYVVPAAQRQPSVGGLRDHAAARLPSYMVPAAFVFLDRLPLNPNGKVDRRKLPTLSTRQRALGESHVAPRTPVEQVLANLFSEILGVESVGIHDGFFVLGGHSLLATRVISRLRETFQIELPIRELFENPTVIELAASIEAAVGAAWSLRASPIEPADRGQRLPLSFAQERLWSLDRTEPGSPAHNLCSGFRIGGPLDTGALAAAFGEAVRRHEILRTVFVAREGPPEQVILPAILATSVLPDRIDLRSLEPAGRELELRRLAGHQARPFDLARGPLLRLALVRMQDEEHVLLVTTHRIVSDGRSIAVLTREVQELYGAILERRAPSLPGLPVQYADFAAWQRQWIEGQLLAEEVEFWQEHLRGLPPRLKLPTDRPRPAARSSAGHAEALPLPAALLAPLYSLCQRSGVTPFMVLLALFEILLQRYSGQEAFAVGTPVAGRNRPELEGLIGLFANVIPLRADLSGNPGFEVLLARVRDRALAAHLHQDLPFEALVGELQSEVFQVLFALEEALADKVHPGGPPMRPLPGIVPDPALYDLSLTVQGGRDALVLQMNARSDLFEPATVRRMGHHLIALLEQGVSDPARPLDRFVLLSDAEGAQLAAEWNGTAAPRPADLPLRLGGLGGRLPTPPLVAVPRQGAMPLSFAQQRLWFIGQLEPDSPLYNVPVALRVEGRLEAPVLARSLGEIVRRHEALRTVFASAEGVPVQVIRPAGDSLLAVIDLSGLPEPEREREALWLAWLEGRRPFDLARGPLLRAALLQLGAERHVMLFNMHHIVSDGWSMGLLVREVTALYEAFRQGLPSPLPELAVQYADFAHWQRQWLSGEVLESEVAHWRQRLAGAPPLLELPTDRPRPAVQTYRGAEQPLELSRELSGALWAFSRSEGVTLFMTLLAAFQLLLSRYSGQRDLTVGTPIAGRNRLETEGLIGFFINTLVLRGDLSDAPSFRELLGRVREMVLDAYTHQDLPFEMLVEQLQPERSLSHEPLFQVMLTLEATPRSRKVELPGLTMRPVVAESGLVHFDLTLGVVDGSETLWWSMDYRTELFDGTTIARMNGHLQNLLQSLVADPQRRLPEVGLLTDGERGQLLLEWNDTAAPFPRRRCLHELFEAQVERTPDAPALLHDEGSLTYRELNRRANRLALELRLRGVEPETLVAIHTSRSAYMAVAFLGVLKAGGAFMPLDPDYPRERLAFLLSDSGARLLLTQERLAAGFREHGVETVLLDRGDRGDRGDAGPGPGENPAPAADPANLAYMFYTSGSTGQPKGALVPHSAVVNYALDMVERFGLGPADRVLQFAAPSFDVVIEEMFPAWLAGAAVVLRESERLTSLRDLRRTIESYGVTVLELPAAYWHEWSYDLEATGMPAPASLRLMIVGSEKPLPERVEAWRRLGVDLIYIFGLTETTVTSTLHRMPAGAAGGSDLPIGRPIANTRVYLLDADGQPAPVGVPGEMYLGGEGVARGYLGRPELTAARFVPDPFGAGPGGRLYRTGDLARYRADGNLEFLGRIDEQVSVRGFRIEPGEIEAALGRHPAVREAVVVARQDAPGAPGAPGDSHLVAYLVPDPDRSGRTEQAELWPSQGCYDIYDDVLYYAMTSDERRNRHYRVAMEHLVRDKVVVDVGAGADVILSRLCVEAGARAVYAIEILRESFDRAAILIRDLGLEDRIHLIHGASTEVELPEKADVVVSELIGTIGSSEGVIPVLNDARRFLHAGGAMIPQRCLTRIAAARLPDRLGTKPAFTEVSGYYVEKVFEKEGGAFDLRLCIRNFPRENLASTADLFEDLDFSGPIDTSSRREVTLTIVEDCVIDGFLLWVNLNTIGEEVLDVLDYAGCWSPLFLPVFFPGIEVSAGDTIEVVCIRQESPADRWKPDYRVEGTLLRQGEPALTFEYDLPRAERRWQHHPYYERLFSGGTIPIAGPIAGNTRAELSAQELREHLLESLPEHMVPPTFVFLPALPLTLNGKVDRQALPAPANGSRPRSLAPPRDLLELQIVQVWEDLLGRHVGLRDHFFEIGGHSLLAVRATARLERLLGRRIPVSQLLHHPTAETLAALLRRGGQASDPPFVALRNGGGRRPLFFVHPAGGSVLCYHDLARHLDRPFYGVQAMEAPNAGIEAMAAGYLERLRSAVPEGPYLLGGWSMGGVVAYEMACQLVAAGQDVAFLALVDAFPPSPGDTARSALLARIGAFVLELGLPAEELGKLRIPEAAGLPPQDLWTRLFALAQERGLLPPDIPEERLRSLFDDFAANAEALQSYKPQAFPGRVSLFLAADEARNGLGPAAWEGLAAGVEVHELAGDHYSILREPGVAMLAVRLRESMKAGDLT